MTEQLAQLPPPERGWARVYRGQHALHGSVKPSGLRAADPRPDERLFRVYSHLLVDMLADEQSALARFESWALWVHALAQQYGPGSRFLDATVSPAVALWFALHESARIAVRAAFGPDGPLDPAMDVIGDFELIRFDATPGAGGYVLVFDVPRWPAEQLPAHGELVDLTAAPEFISSSSRVRSQSAALIAADPGVAAGDLRACQVAEIPVTAADQAPRTDALSVADLFPAPQIDPWYARLLSIPLKHRIKPGACDLELTQTLPVALYQTSEAATLDTISRLVVLEPPILAPYIKAEVDRAASWLPPGFAPHDVTEISLELPLLAMTAPLGDELWNPIIATVDIPETASTVDACSGQKSELGLSNVLIDFSPLELTIWTGIESRDAGAVLTRGAYLEREGDTFALWCIDQTIPAGTITIDGPYCFAVKGDPGDQELRLASNRASYHLSDAPGPSKTLLVILMILQELRKRPSPSPLATSVLDGNVAVIPLLGGGELLRPAGRETCFVRDAHGAPSTFGLLLNRRFPRSIAVRHGTPWATVQPDELTATDHSSPDW